MYWFVAKNKKEKKMQMLRLHCRKLNMEKQD